MAAHRPEHLLVVTDAQVSVLEPAPEEWAFAKNILSDEDFLVALIVEDEGEWPVERLQSLLGSDGSPVAKGLVHLNHEGSLRDLVLCDSV